MEIDLDKLIAGDGDSPKYPRDIFFTLEKDSKFSFPRDVQSEVLDAWFKQRDNKDSVIKLNVGSGKTLVGLLALQSSLNEGISPAVFVSSDNYLAQQVATEAENLGISTTSDEDDIAFRSGQSILVCNIHKLFNGRSAFGVGTQGVKIEIGAIVIDDVHACLSSITDQFRIAITRDHALYKWVLQRFEAALKEQSFSQFLAIRDGDPQYYLEIPFWNWQEAATETIEQLHDFREEYPLRFSYPLLKDLIPMCRAVIGGAALEIAPICPPTDLIQAFRQAKRRIYMTATLSDDSVLVTHFGAHPSGLSEALTPASTQAMGERMIIMPQQLNSALNIEHLKPLIRDVAARHNVVVIVPSRYASKAWRSEAAQILIGDSVSSGVARLQAGEHVGLTVLVNRYDGIDLPGDACRLLVINDLPEATSLIGRNDSAVLGESTYGLRRHIQRIEQGMGRGVRSTDDHCIILLFGSRLTQRLLSPTGKEMLTPATRAQLELSTQLAKQIAGSDMADLAKVFEFCLQRNKKWTKAARTALVNAAHEPGLRIDSTQVCLRSAFDKARHGDHRGASKILNEEVNKVSDLSMKAWLRARLAETTNFFDRSEAQRILYAAHKTNVAVLRPIEGIAYEKISPSKSAQAVAAQAFLRTFLESPERMLFAKALAEALVFTPGNAERFEQALADAGRLIGITSQRPEKQLNRGPDNLFALRTGKFLVIECKNGSVASTGFSKDELGQLEQAVTWFQAAYGLDIDAVPILVHPQPRAKEPAVPIHGMRVIDEKRLSKLVDAIVAFVRAVAPHDVLEDERRVREALHSFKLNEGAFLTQFSVTAK